MKILYQELQMYFYNTKVFDITGLFYMIIYLVNFNGGYPESYYKLITRNNREAVRILINAIEI